MTTLSEDGNRRGRAGVAAFDFDGTLVRGDSVHVFLTQLLGPRRLGAALFAAGPAMGLGYVRGGRDRAKAALFFRALPGIEAARVDALGRSFGRQLAGRVRADLAARLHWHRDRGHRLVLVSASLTNYLEPFAAEVGIDDVIATRLEVGDDGRLTGRMAGPNVRGQEKATRLRALLGPSPVELWAYGDSRGDREMLAMADHPRLVDEQVVPPPDAVAGARPGRW
ncbi:MAG: HAD family hydrolase [Acidimicrobiaceae bacterium]|nr:HAD family hydrolase [Acidimicrobiaceae bacterium]MBO0747142.1 HAD family hydrolase [Acidimicrobiaceae bacterium]